MVELKNISFRYGSAERQEYAENSLSGIDLTIHDGEFVPLTGPSGCGKTTILRLINGLIPHFYSGCIDGEVLIGGKPVASQELYETALMAGTVFQNPRSQFYTTDTTGELAFGCENRGLPAEQIYKRIDDTAARFSIEKLMDRNIFQLSDGEKQKIACASIDAAGAEIILLDEPSANLDYEAAIALRDLILEWRRQGKTIIAAEHRIAYLWDLIDCAVILQEGKIVRRLRGEEINTLTECDLREMGLRSMILESPSNIRLPSFAQGDEPFTLKDLKFTYSGLKEPVVNLSELTLAAGEITAVTGANGAGKTSLLSCICGLEKRCKGSLIFAGKTYRRKDRQKLCFMVMQDTGNQLFTESVLEEVLISLPENTENEKERAEEILRALDLEPFLDRHPQSLSGG